MRHLEVREGAVSVDFDPVFGCLLATGRTDRDGYVYSGKSRAHIVAWTAEHGPVPEGKEIDHTCRRRRCTFHLELVTRGENELRKSWRYRCRIRLCPRGHRLADGALVTPEGGRVCLQCRDEALLERNMPR